MTINLNAIPDLIPPEISSVYPLEMLVFVDIETTGFSAQYHQIINIGLLHYSSGWTLTQYWATTASEEKEMLQKFIENDQSNQLYIAYNGKTFDIPFILKRLAHHKLPDLMLRNRLLDFVRMGRAYSRLNSIPSYSFQALEQHFELTRLNDVSGENIIETFHLYIKTFDPELKSSILRHNALDVLHMPLLLKSISDADAPLLTQLIPLIFQVGIYVFALQFRYHHDTIVFEGTVSPPYPTPCETITGAVLKIDTTDVTMQFPIVKLSSKDHQFVRIDSDVSFCDKEPYDQLELTDKAKLIIEMDGYMQTHTLIELIKRLIQEV